ncbi:MAG: uroporphyrinogen-III synthase [Myxococcota bacterium]
MSGALRGRTVLSTRPLDDDALTPLLQAEGAEVLVAPMIHFAPPAHPDELEGALASLSRYRAVLLTSPRGVRSVAGRLPAGFPVVTLAGRTRQEAVSAGLTPLPIRDAPDGADLAAALAESMDVTGARFLLPTSNLAEPAVAEGLRARGATVDVVEAYRTVPATEVPAPVVQALREGRVDAVVCMSPSAVRTLVTLVPVELLGRVKRVAPGRTTSAAWGELGLPADVVAEGPAPAQVVSAVVRALTQAP